MAITLSLRRQSEDPDASLLLFPEAAGQPESAWTTSEEGRLAVDVCETDVEIIIRSAIAGVRPENLEVTLHNDMLTVRGSRFAEDEPGARLLVQECHWGAFSRSIILPAETDADRITAAIKDGVLTVRLPKVRRERRIGIRDVS